MLIVIQLDFILVALDWDVYRGPIRLHFGDLGIGHQS